MGVKTGRGMAGREAGGGRYGCVGSAEGGLEEEEEKGPQTPPADLTNSTWSSVALVPLA